MRPDLLVYSNIILPSSFEIQEYQIVFSAKKSQEQGIIQIVVWLNVHYLYGYLTKTLMP